MDAWELLVVAVLIGLGGGAAVAYRSKRRGDAAAIADAPLNGPQAAALAALPLHRLPVRHVMRPRVEVEALEIDTPPDEVLGALAMSGFSRLPVYEGDLDHVVGLVYAKDVLLQHFMARPLQLRRLLRPAVFVPQTLPVARLLEVFRRHRTQMAVVLDEYGGTEGLVTLQDVLRELVGEIHDQHDEPPAPMLVRQDEQGWLADGRLPLRELAGQLQPAFDEPIAWPDQVSTLSGLVLYLLDRAAVAGDAVQWQNLHLEVLATNGRRIDQVRIQRRDQTDEPSGRSL